MTASLPARPLRGPNAYRFLRRIASAARLRGSAASRHCARSEASHRPANRAKHGAVTPAFAGRKLGSMHTVQNQWIPAFAGRLARMFTSLAAAHHV
jgi:hypothetical protein